jgi:hypothetical protein
LFSLSFYFSHACFCYNTCYNALLNQRHVLKSASIRQFHYCTNSTKYTCTNQDSYNFTRQYTLVGLPSYIVHH